LGRHGSGLRRRELRSTDIRRDCVRDRNWLRAGYRIARSSLRTAVNGLAVGADDEEIVAVLIPLLASTIRSGRAAIVVAAPAFEAIEEIELHISRLEHVGTRQLWGAACLERVNQLRRDENHDFLLAVRGLIQTGQRSEQRQVAEEGDAGRGSAQRV
jgi:hypothetical protein